MLAGLSHRVAPLRGGSLRSLGMALVKPRRWLKGYAKRRLDGRSKTTRRGAEEPPVAKESSGPGCWHHAGRQKGGAPGPRDPLRVGVRRQEGELLKAERIQKQLRKEESQGPVHGGDVPEEGEEMPKDAREVRAYVRPVPCPAKPAGVVDQHDVPDPRGLGLRLRSLGKLRVGIGVLLRVCQDTADWRRRDGGSRESVLRLLELWRLPE